MNHIANWLMAHDGTLAAIVMLGVAVLVVCGLQCTKCGSKDADDLFDHHGM